MPQKYNSSNDGPDYVSHHRFGRDASQSVMLARTAHHKGLCRNCLEQLLRIGVSRSIEHLRFVAEPTCSNAFAGAPVKAAMLAAIVAAGKSALIFMSDPPNVSYARCSNA